MARLEVKDRDSIGAPSRPTFSRELIGMILNPEGLAHSFGNLLLFIGLSRVYLRHF